MKLARLFFLLVILAGSAAATFAQTTVDPKVIVNFGPGDPASCTPSPTLICYDGSGPLVESYTDPEAFEYTGDSNLDELYLEFTDVPSMTSFECQTNIWTNCSTITGPYPDDVGIEFELYGSGTPSPGGAGTCSDCQGYLSSGDLAAVAVEPLVTETPEPGSIILFGTGLISFFLVAKRRSLST